MRGNTLLIDDDPVFSGYFAELLASAGIDHVECRGDARTVLSVNTDLEKYTRIFCDLNMPGVDGIEFIRKLADREWKGDLFIVSGEAESVVRTSTRLAKLTGLNLGGSLRKPVHLPQLLTLINEGVSAATGNLPKNVLSKRRADITHAIETASTVPVYQPQLNLSTLSIDGFEALMRLRLPDGTLANPGEFFPQLTKDEEAKLTMRFLEQTMRDFAQVSGAGVKTRGSINLSPSMLRVDPIVQQLRNFAERYDVDPASIIVEVTETEPMLKDPDLMSAMSRLRIAGFGLALDDFGTGHANIHELGWFPFSEIKTDLSFGQKLTEDRFARAVVEFAVRAARQLELKLTIEGVESAAAVEVARAIGGNRAQGYAIAKPLSREQAYILAGGTT